MNLSLEAAAVWTETVVAFQVPSGMISDLLDGAVGIAFSHAVAASAACDDASSSVLSDPRMLCRP